MQITGSMMQAAYFQTAYKGNRGRAQSPAVQAVDALAGKRTSAESVGRRPETQAGGFADILLMQYKKDSIKKQEDELEDARINDPEKYKQMLDDREAASIKSFDQLVDFISSGKTSHSYQNIAVDTDNKRMEIGDVSGENVITVGLSNGWALHFSRDNIDQVAGMLDIFSPEDVRRIMEAITKDNMADEQLEEVDREKADSCKTEDQKAADQTKDAERATEEDSKVSTQIIVNPDGSRQLMVTIKIGDVEQVMNIKLTPEKADENSADAEKSFQRTPRDASQMNALENSLSPSRFAIQNAASAYEANFAYA